MAIALGLASGAASVLLPLEYPQSARARLEGLRDDWHRQVDRCIDFALREWAS